MSIVRIQASAYATSRRNAYRVPIEAVVSINGVEGRLVDISVGGAAVSFPRGHLPRSGGVELALPGAAPVPMEMVRVRPVRTAPTSRRCGSGTETGQPSARRRCGCSTPRPAWWTAFRSPPRRSPPQRRTAPAASRPGPAAC